MSRRPTTVTQLVGETIRELRQKKGLTQQELADLAGLERTFVNGVENGVHSPSIVTVAKLALGLDVPPSQLLRKVDDVRGTIVLE